MMKALLQNLHYSLRKKAYTDVLFVSDGANWVLNWEILEVAKLARRFGVRTRLSGSIPVCLPRQAIFFASKYILRYPRRYLSAFTHVAFPYFHGYPDSGEPVAIECYNNLKRFHSKISRVQVSHSRMHDLILSTGIDPSKVFRIPIGINMAFFKRQTPESRNVMRNKYGIPQQAVVIGSFQKDGNGWGQGTTPKLIKGPDVFLKAVKIIRESIPEIFVFLSGPARGYVKKGLERLKIPYKHIYLNDYPEIGELYQCLDLYIVASREEGGPKAVLESMASGIPLVTTRVGQAMDMVKHGENGWVVDVDDAEGLAYRAGKALSDTVDMQRVLANALRTAQANTYEAQMGLWKEFFRGFVQTH